MRHDIHLTHIPYKIIYSIPETNGLIGKGDEKSNIVSCRYSLRILISYLKLALAKLLILK